MAKTLSAETAASHVIESMKARSRNRQRRECKEQRAAADKDAAAGTA